MPDHLPACREQAKVGGARGVGEVALQQLVVGVTNRSTLCGLKEIAFAVRQMLEMGDGNHQQTRVERSGCAHDVDACGRILREDFAVHLRVWQFPVGT